MARKILKNKPLVEALVEVRWSLRQLASGEVIDPHYKLLLGRLYDRLQSDYPEHEPLPTSSVPDEMVGHMVQHRFRSGPNRWPLVQVGPGVMTVNSTEDYTWEDFRPRVISVISRLFEAYPRPADLKVEALMLRYIDAVQFDYGRDDALAFFRDKLKIAVAFPASLFESEKVEPRPHSLVFQSAFRCKNPSGMVHLRFATGQNKDAPAVLWETTIRSTRADVPAMPVDFERWLDASHDVTSDWFFKLIEGDLERRFSE